MQEQVLGHDLLRGHVGDPGERQHLVRPAGGEQRRRQAEGVGGDDVVVGEAVDQEQRPGRRGGQREQRAGVVDLGLLAGIAQVALRVVGVVEPPLGDRRAGDGGVEHVRAPQHGEGGEVAAEAPAADRHALQVEDAVLLGRPLKCLDLVLEDRRGEVDGPLAPTPTRARRTPPVGDDDGEPLVGHPLCPDVGVVGAHDPPGVRTAIRVDEHRER